MAAVGGARALDTLCAAGEKGLGTACPPLLIAEVHTSSVGVGGDGTVQTLDGWAIQLSRWWVLQGLFAVPSILCHEPC